MKYQTLALFSRKKTRSKRRHVLGVFSHSPDKLANCAYENDTNDYLSLGSSISNSSFCLINFKSVSSQRNHCTNQKAQHHNTMKLLAQNLIEKTPVIDTINPHDTIATLKLTISESDGHAMDEQRLLYNGTELKDELSLVDCEVKDSAIGHLVITQRGMAKIFTNEDIMSDPQLAYPMVTDEAHSTASLLVDFQRKVRNLDQTKDFDCTQYPELSNGCKR